MTLILAEVSQNDGFFVADTLLSFEFQDPIKGAGPFNGKFHALKVHILSGNLCMALAGDYHLGLLVINQVAAYLEKIKEPIDGSILQIILSFYKKICSDQNQLENVCDFLVMLNITSQNILAKIKNGKLQCCEKAYIGNQLAYVKLQSVRVPYEASKYTLVQQPDNTFKNVPFQVSDLEKNFNEISDAMMMIPTQKKTDVAIMGDSVTRVRVARVSGKFEYMQQVTRGLSKEEGDIGVSLLSSMSPKYGIGIFYLGGGFGDLFIAGDIEYSRRIKALAINDFIKAAYRDHQLILTGATW